MPMTTRATHKPAPAGLLPLLLLLPLAVVAPAAAQGQQAWAARVSGQAAGQPITQDQQGDAMVLHARSMLATAVRRPPAKRPPPPSPTPPPPSVIQSSCGQVQEGVVLLGADLSPTGVQGFDIEDCCSACSTRDGCAAFTFVPWASACYLKSADGGWLPIPADNVMSVVLDGSGLLSPLPPSPQPPAPNPPPPSPAKKQRPPPPAPKQLSQLGPNVPTINQGQCSSGSPPTVLQSLGKSRSTYHYYHPEYRVSTLYCADAFAGKTRTWLMSYPWVAYCAPYLGGMSQDKCGKLLRMTNTRTGSQVIVRIVDMCGHSAIDADQQSAFIPLDTDGQGYLDGQLSVNLELVTC